MCFDYYLVDEKKCGTRDHHLVNPPHGERSTELEISPWVEASTACLLTADKAEVSISVPVFSFA